jgi:hypothetical protein
MTVKAVANKIHFPLEQVKTFYSAMIAPFIAQ